MANKLLLIIKADTNDADYIHSITPITEEILEELKPIFEVIKNCDDQYNWSTSENGIHPSDLYEDKLTQEQIDNFGEFVPYGEYGVHTIESIKVLEVVKETKYL